MRRSPAIFSVYMPSNQALTSSNVTPGPWGCKFAGPRLGGLPHLPVVPRLHVNRPLLNKDSWTFNVVIFFLIMESLNKIWANFVIICHTVLLLKSVLSSTWLKFPTLYYYYNTVLQIYQNSLKSCLIYYSINYPYIELCKCHLLISVQTLYILTTVLHTNSWVTCGFWLICEWRESLLSCFGPSFSW